MDYLNNVIEISKPSYYSQITAKNEFLQGKLKRLLATTK